MCTLHVPLSPWQHGNYQQQPLKKKDAVHKMYYQLCTIMLLIENNQIFLDFTDSPLEYKLQRT